MADDFRKQSEVRDVELSSHNILPSANQPMGESHIGNVGIFQQLCMESLPHPSIC